MNMIEKVARALMAADGTVRGAPADYWKHYADPARAAIEAMREPPDAVMDQMALAMLNAYGANLISPDAISMGRDNHQRRAIDNRVIEAMAAHAAMIDAALESQ